MICLCYCCFAFVFFSPFRNLNVLALSFRCLCFNEGKKWSFSLTSPFTQLVKYNFSFKFSFCLGLTAYAISEFARTWVFVLHVCLLLLETRKGSWICWTWSCRWLSIVKQMLRNEPGPPEEKSVLLPTEPFFQTQAPYMVLTNHQGRLSLNSIISIEFPHLITPSALYF